MIPVLKIKRMEKGLRQFDVARRMNLSEQMICNWETGRKPVAKKHRACLAKILGVKISEIFPKAKEK